MIKLLTEDKNLHLTHLQDKVITGGMEGTKEAISFLDALKDMFEEEGTSKSKVDISVKWDGAPAIFAGINPETKKFFVGTKGIFAQNAKLNYTNADIDRNHPNSGLNDKLKVALKYLPELGIKGILQGDMMFTQGDLKDEKIDGESCVVFQPNTIAYAVPKSEPLAQRIQQAKIGVVWHTLYTGDRISNLQAHFGYNTGNLQPTRNVWSRDATYFDASGTVNFTEGEKRSIQGYINQCRAVWKSISPAVLNQISGNELYTTELMAWNNMKVREGQEIGDTAAHTKGFLVYLGEKLNKGIIEAKREDTKAKRIKEKNIIMNFFTKCAGELKKIFDLQNLITEAKHIIVAKLQQIKDIGTFFKTDNGFKATNHEGFVAVHTETGNAVKLIQQLEFSHANFTAAKDWDR